MVLLSVCIGSACHIKGSYAVISVFDKLINDYGLSHEVELKAVFCLGHCTNPVSVQVDNEEVQSVSGESAHAFFINTILPRVKKNNAMGYKK